MKRINETEKENFYLSGERIEDYRKNFGDTLTLGEVLKIEKEKTETRFKEMGEEEGRFLSLKEMNFEDIRKTYLSEKRKALDYIKSEEVNFELNDLIRVIAIKEILKRMILESGDNKSITIMKKVLI